MLDYLKGTIVDISPTHVVLDNNGIGYFVNISINTYSNLSGKEQVLLYIHEVIREDTHQLYGFSNQEERGIFLHLISVNGVGANTARVMLSSLAHAEIVDAIAHNDVNLLKSIKGIGAKTAERIIVDLRDKVAKIADGEQIVTLVDNTIKDEALSALVMLGFPKSKVEKVIHNILKQKSDYSVEELIKEALKRI